MGQLQPELNHLLLMTTHVCVVVAGYTHMLNRAFHTTLSTPYVDGIEWLYTNLRLFPNLAIDVAIDMNRDHEMYVIVYAGHLYMWVHNSLRGG